MKNKQMCHIMNMDFVPLIAVHVQVRRVQSSQSCGKVEQFDEHECWAINRVGTQLSEETILQ